MDYRVRQAILAKEIERVKTFLAGFDFTLDESCNMTIYMEDQGQIIATISASNHVLKDLAVDPAYQGEQLASQLILYIMMLLKEKGYHHYFVFTKRKNTQIFIDLGFHVITQTSTVCFLENGVYTIDDYLLALKKQYQITTSDNGVCVINGNPFSKGHYQLVEYAAKKHKTLLVFIVEENLSEFSFQERFFMAKNALQELKNVIVIPSSEYMISSSVFPTYFIKEDSVRSQVFAELDITIFKEHFMPIFEISKRYIGEEVHSMMVMYNQTMKNILKDQVEMIPRFDVEGKTISASKIRSDLEQKYFLEALKMIPQANHAFIMKKFSHNDDE